MARSICFGLPKSIMHRLAEHVDAVLVAVQFVVLGRGKAVGEHVLSRTSSSSVRSSEFFSLSWSAPIMARPGHQLRKSLSSEGRRRTRRPRSADCRCTS